MTKRDLSGHSGTTLHLSNLGDEINWRSKTHFSTSQPVNFHQELKYTLSDFMINELKVFLLGSVPRRKALSSFITVLQVRLVECNAWKENRVSYIVYSESWESIFHEIYALISGRLYILMSHLILNDENYVLFLNVFSHVTLHHHFDDPYLVLIDKIYLTCSTMNQLCKCLHFVQIPLPCCILSVVNFRS